MKKRKLYFVLTFLLTFNVILLNITNSVCANTNESTLISEGVSDELTKYTHDVIDKHFYSISKDFQAFGMKNAPVEQYSLGQYFSVYNYKTLETVYFYTILCNNEIEALIQITENDNEFGSSVSKSFASELKTLLSDSKGLSYKLITDGNRVYALTENSMQLLYQITPNENYTQNVIKFDDVYNEKQLYEVSYDDLTITSKKLSNNSLTRADPNRPLAYKTLNVKGVSQGQQPWCWAATCAAMINYYKGKTLTASTVAKYVFPSNPYQGGNWDNMKKAYTHWGVKTTYKEGRISFGTIKSNINSNKAIHLRLTGHSLGLIGYEDWSDRNMLILLEPNGGVQKSVTLKSNGNFDYYLTGANSWLNTILF